MMVEKRQHKLKKKVSASAATTMKALTLETAATWTTRAQTYRKW